MFLFKISKYSNKNPAALHYRSEKHCLITLINNRKKYTELFYPYPAEFLKWNNPTSIFGNVHYNFWGYEDDQELEVGQPTIIIKAK